MFGRVKPAKTCSKPLNCKTPIYKKHRAAHFFLDSSMLLWINKERAGLRICFKVDPD
jgi:hypothetical protein